VRTVTGEIGRHAANTLKKLANRPVDLARPSPYVAARLRIQQPAK
jgi:hypothetical protein